MTTKRESMLRDVDFEKLKKKELLELLKKIGHTDEHIEWLKKRYTARALRSVLQNALTHETIIRMTRQPRRN